MSGHGAPTLAASDLEGSQLKVAVVASRWHEQIMDGLLDGAHGLLGGDPTRLVRRLAKLLPEDVRVFGVREVSPLFDARFAALSRSYTYKVTTNPAGAVPTRRADTAGDRRGGDPPPRRGARPLHRPRRALPRRARGRGARVTGI